MSASDEFKKKTVLYGIAFIAALFLGPPALIALFIFITIQFLFIFAGFPLIFLLIAIPLVIVIITLITDFIKVNKDNYKKAQEKEIFNL
tara:strand:+ start:572 stop:838 length:267 start_codon:yes stop_codon:yes gene_type:complete